MLAHTCHGEKLLEPVRRTPAAMSTLLAMPPHLAGLLSRDGGDALARSDLPAASRRYRPARTTACMASPPSGGGPSNGNGSASKRNSTSTYRDGPAPMPTSKGFPLPANSSFLSFEDLHERHPHAPIGHNARVGSANFSQRLLQGEQILQSYLSGRVHQVGPSFARHVLSFVNRAGPAPCQWRCHPALPGADARMANRPHHQQTLQRSRQFNRTSAD